MPFAEFRRRFALLAPEVSVEEATAGDERAAVDQLMLQLDVDAASYRLGLSQVSRAGWRESVRACVRSFCVLSFFLSFIPSLVSLFSNSPTRFPIDC